jgi:glycosyltransferase involved in cell wall biosynthesis
VPQWLSKPITRWLVKNFCTKVDELIVPGKSVAQYIATQGITRPMHSIPLSILPVFFHTTPPAKQSSDHCILLSASRFAPEKNLFFLLDMYAQLPQNRYHLVLIGYGALEEELKTYAYDTLGLSTHAVTFIIKPPKQELVDRYAQADLFVFTSQSETQGLVLAEAMAGATPVVALYGPGVQDIVINGTNGFMVDSQNEMIRMIEHIHADAQLYNTLSNGAWHTAQRYTPMQRTKAVLDIYTKYVQTNL